MEGMQWAIIAVISSFFATYCEGLPARGCPKYQTTFYVADTLNQCMYYRCQHGRFVGGPRLCAPGLGVSLFYSSDTNPCRIKVIKCIRTGGYFGSPGKVSHPPPTKTMFTYRPTTTPVPEPTTEPSVTELIGMTTEEDPEMTTQMVTEVTTQMEDMTTMEDDVTTEDNDVTTEEPGSGEGEDDQTSGVYFDKTIPGGVEWEAADFESCLKACHQVMPLCWVVDWAAPDTCKIHLTGLGDQCPPLSDKPDNVHIRFRCTV